MQKIFVSSERVDNEHIAALIDRLRQENFQVFHSPRNPLDGDDIRWHGWYASGFQKELNQVDIFIVGVTRGWSCSTWMGMEAEEARQELKSGRIRQMFYYNPMNLVVGENMARSYLKERLPDDLDAMITSLRQHKL